MVVEIDRRSGWKDWRADSVLRRWSMACPWIKIRAGEVVLPIRVLSDVIIVSCWFCGLWFGRGCTRAPSLQNTRRVARVTNDETRKFYAPIWMELDPTLIIHMLHDVCGTFVVAGKV